MKDDFIPTVSKGLLGVMSAAVSSQVSLAKINLIDLDMLLGVLAKAGGIMVAIATLISIGLTIRKQWLTRQDIRTSSAARRDESSSSSVNILHGAIALGLCFGFSGCTQLSNSIDTITGKSSAKQKQLTEESKALTTGTVDALEQAPREDKAVNLARELAKADQQIEGMPTKRLPVTAALAEDPKALRELERRLAAIPLLQAELEELQSKLADRESQLQDLGRKYEEERATKLRTRIKRWLIGTLGVGGVIALLVCFPALIVPFGHMLAFLVGRIPKLAGALGVVAKKAFDETVEGIGKARAAMKAAQSQDKIILDNTLSENTSEWTKALIASRRKVLKV